MDINDVKLNWKERTDVLSKMIKTFGKQKTAEQIDGFIDKLIVTILFSATTILSAVFQPIK